MHIYLGMCYFIFVYIRLSMSVLSLCLSVCILSGILTWSTHTAMQPKFQHLFLAQVSVKEVRSQYMPCSTPGALLHTVKTLSNCYEVRIYCFLIVCWREVITWCVLLRETVLMKIV